MKRKFEWDRSCKMEFCRYIKNWKCTKEDPLVYPDGTCTDFKCRSLIPDDDFDENRILCVTD